MPIQVIEHVTSRAEEVAPVGGSSELIFTVMGTDSSIAARNAVAAEAPATYHKLIRGTMSISPHGAGVWTVKVKYEALAKITIAIDGMPEKVKIHKSKETIRNYQVADIDHLGTVGPSFDRLIGVDKQHVNGVDIYAAGSFKIQFQWTKKWDTMDSDYFEDCLARQATTNNTDVILNYKGQQLKFERGEILFLGPAFHDSDEGSEMTLKFEGQRNEILITAGELDGSLATMTSEGDMTLGGVQISNIANTTMGSTTLIGTEALMPGMNVDGAGITPGSVIVSVDSDTEITLDKPFTATGVGVDLTITYLLFIAKKGHQYIWLRTAKHKHPLTGTEVDKVFSAHVERVYDESDFGPLKVFDVVNAQDEEDEVDELDLQMQQEIAGLDFLGLVVKDNEVPAIEGLDIFGMIPVVPLVDPPPLEPP